MDYEEIQEQNQFEKLIQGLIDDQYGCCDDFVTPGTVAGLRANIDNLDSAGFMNSAGFGNKKDFHKDNHIRGDKISWIDAKSTNPYETTYIRKVENFMNHLNTTCFTSLKSFESHYSKYDQHSFYKRHLDQFKNEKGRKYSIVLYLNQDWLDEDGGKLSLYPKGKETKYISPIGGRMIFFRSDEMEHEVLPSLTRVRTSIACWLKN